MVLANPRHAAMCMGHAATMAGSLGCAWDMDVQGPMDVQGTCSDNGRQTKKLVSFLLFSLCIANCTC